MVVRRVLVLIQVAALRAARQAHACHNLTVATRKNQAPTDARSPLSRLANLRMIPVGADIDFVDPGWLDDLPSVSLLHLLDHLGADLSNIHPILEA